MPKPAQPNPIRINTTKLAFFLLAWIIVAILIIPLLGAPRKRPWFVNDLSNLQSIAQAIQNYAIEHDGQLPPHASLIKDGTHVGDWEFVSRHDPNGQNKPTNNNPEPDDWYTLGSYRFCPTKTLNTNDIPDPATFVIAYCPPYKDGIDGKDHPTAFLDGSAKMLSKDELFHLIITQQQQRITQLSAP